MQLEEPCVNESSAIEETLTFLQRYEDSRLLTLEELAKILRRSPQGLRVTLGRDNELARKLAHARLKIGRRVLFRASVVAQFLAIPAPEGA